MQSDIYTYSLNSNEQQLLKNGHISDVFVPIFKVLDKNIRTLLIQTHPVDVTPRELHERNSKIAPLLGNLLVQNTQGDTTILVYDRDRLGSMFNGARYHQTREGGTIHTDNVNIPQPWDYLYLACIKEAHVGGENILVDAFVLYKVLKEQHPKALSILEQDFYWEMRGVSQELYKAPIITYNEKNEPLFRHLRPYMESAHVRANVPLTNEQLYALDVLDALTNSTALQMRYRMQTGDILITVDSQVLHGRCCFSDEMESITYPEYLEGKVGPLKRTMERMWLTKHK